MCRFLSRALLELALFLGFVLFAVTLDTIYLGYPPPWSWRPWVYPFTYPDFVCKKRRPEKLGECSVKYILPALGQTGTTSVNAALQEMGIRTFHAEENIIFARHALKEETSMTEWRRTMTMCNVEAIALEPLSDVFSIAIEACPKAKVILTVRDHPSWKRSTDLGGSTKDVRWGSFIMTLASSWHYLPWAEVYDTVTGHFLEFLESGDEFKYGKTSFPHLLAFYVFGMRAYHGPLTMTSGRGVFKVLMHEEAYLAQLSEVRRLTPPGNLLEFDVRKHGWKELAAFVGKPEPPAGTRFPHPRSKDSWTNDVIWHHSPFENRAGIIVVFVCTHVVNFLLTRLVLNVLLRPLRALFCSRAKGKTE